MARRRKLTRNITVPHSNTTSWHWCSEGPSPSLPFDPLTQTHQHLPWEESSPSFSCPIFFFFEQIIIRLLALDLILLPCQMQWSFLLKYPSDGFLESELPCYDLLCVYFWDLHHSAKHCTFCLNLLTIVGWRFYDHVGPRIYLLKCSVTLFGKSKCTASYLICV